MNADADRIRADLTAFAARKQEAERLRAAAMEAIRDALPRGKQAGISITELAALADVTRQTCYSILQEGE